MLAEATIRKRKREQNTSKATNNRTPAAPRPLAIVVAGRNSAAPVAAARLSAQTMKLMRFMATNASVSPMLRKGPMDAAVNADMRKKSVMKAQNAMQFTPELPDSTPIIIAISW